MSYMTIAIKNNTYDSIKDSNFVALWGISHDKLLYKYLKENPHIENINICFDNDIDGTIIKNGEIIKYNHGQRRANEIKAKLDEKYKVNILTPIEKDYNDVLRNMDKNYQDKKEIKLEEKEIIQNKEDKIISTDESNKIQNEEKEIQQNSIDDKFNESKIKEDDYIDMENNSSVDEDLSLKNKEIVEYQEEIEKITKNNAYKMLKAGIDVNTVYDITKYDKKELDKMQQEIVNQNQMPIHGLEVEQDFKLEDDYDIMSI